MLYHQRKQDSLIFVGSETHKDILNGLQFVTKDMFRSDCPIFLPIGYSRTLEVKLDNNMVFYENLINGKYSLIDKFTVNGGPEMVMEIGTWDSNGINMKEKMNRWDRRTDLMGATFVNTLYENKVGSSALFIYDSNGTIMGSRGHYQDQLFYILDRLNVTIETTDGARQGSQKGAANCIIFLEQKLTDICSGGYVDAPCDGCQERHIITKRPTQRTLLARVPKENVLDLWAYVEVFGFTQWFILVLFLIVLSLSTPLSGVVLGGTLQRSSFSESFANTYLFLLQQGNHPETRLWAQRILSFTTSILTLFFFIYYSNDITAKMTAGSSTHPVWNFQDVLDHEYKIIVVGTVELYLLRTARIDSAKHSVYKLYFEEDDKKIWDYLVARENNDVEEMRRIVLPSWLKYTKENFDWAANQVMDDRKTLWYCHRDCAPEEIEQGNVIDLRMDDMSYTYGGFMLRKDSEYVSVISHYVQKGFETGVYHRIHLTYSSRTPIKIGMTEPRPVGMNNVIFPFSFLGVFIIISLLMAMAEKLVKICNKKEVSSS